MTTVHNKAPEKDQAPHVKAGPSTNDDLLKQTDPAELLVRVLQGTNQNLIDLQGSTATAEQYWAVGASNAAIKGNQWLTNLASALNNATDDKQRQNISAQLQVAQTEMSNSDQEYNNVVTGGVTAMNALTQVEAQGLQLGSVAITQKADVNNLLAGWAN